ncbi:MAG: amino acid permease [Gemmatimonadaceae bacterium]|nr:amino acid permease [Gemmatimonadaceae bacterium]
MASPSSLFVRKPLAALQAEAERGLLARTLGVRELTALGIGSVIGTGIFVFTGVAASQHAGPALVISMILSAVACALAGLCYAEFAAMVPVAGSAYTYAYATVGELFAWIIGWDLVLEYALATATVAVGWSGYLVSFLRDVGVHIPLALTGAPGTALKAVDGAPVAGIFNLPAAIIVFVVAGLLIRGIKQSAGVNTLLVVLKCTVLMVFIAVGAQYIQADNLTPFIPANEGTFGAFGVSGILRGAGIMFFAYVGFDSVSTAAQEARNPQRDMPRGMLGSLAICTVIYIGVAVVLTGIVPYKQLNVPDPLAVGIDATGVTWLSPFIKISALFGLFSTMIVTMLGQTRVFFSMSRDGLLPGLFSRVHPRFRTPHASTALVACVIALVAGFTPINMLGELTSIGTLLAFVLVSVGIIVLRRTEPNAPRPFHTPLVPWVPIAAAGACLLQMVSLPFDTWIRLLVWLALGFVVYFAYGRSRAAGVRRAAAAAAAASASAS